MAEVIFPDAMLAIVNLLRTRIAHNNDSIFRAIKIGTRVPETRNERTLENPFVLVRLDGSKLNFRVDEIATIRLVIWHGSEDRAIALAQRIRAILLDYSGDENIRTISSLVGISSTSDPESGTPLSAFTVAVRLRPQTI
jgi:hypothetical protein